jgi:hypothetical protein
MYYIKWLLPNTKSCIWWKRPTKTTYRPSFTARETRADPLPTYDRASTEIMRLYRDKNYQIKGQLEIYHVPH